MDDFQDTPLTQSHDLSQHVKLWQENSSKLEFLVSAIVSGSLAGMEQVEKSGCRLML